MALICSSDSCSHPGKQSRSRTPHPVAMGSALPVLGLLVLMALGLVGCQSPFAQSPSPTPSPTPTATPEPDDWTALRQRPLHLPSLAAGAACPVDHAHQVTPQFGPGVGTGPAYAVLFGDVAGAGDGVLGIAPASNFNSAEWGGQKVLWYMRPDQYEPILVRGHQLDGPNELRFERGDVPPIEDAFKAGPGWTGVATYTRVRAPGCYAYQVDGPDFTEVIVFLAQPE